MSQETKKDEMGVKRDRERAQKQLEIKEKHVKRQRDRQESVFWPNCVVSDSLGEQCGCLWADMAVTEKSNGPVTFQIKMLHCAY